MARPRARQLTLACLLAAAAACASAATIQLTTENSPPASMAQNGQFTGYATDKVREILRRAGLGYTITMVPWKRAFMMAQGGASTCVYLTTRTAEREALFKWVGPIDDNDWVLFARADRNLKLNSLDDARHLRIGTYLGDAREEYLRQRGLQLDSTVNVTDNPGKLMHNRIDVWASGLKWGNATLAQAGLEGQIVPVLTFKHVKLYLACNRAVPDRHIERMNNALRAMNQDGTTLSIDRKYADWLLNPPR